MENRGTKWPLAEVREALGMRHHRSTALQNAKSAWQAEARCQGSLPIVRVMSDCVERPWPVRDQGMRIRVQSHVKANSLARLLLELTLLRAEHQSHPRSWLCQRRRMHLLLG